MPLSRISKPVEWVTPTIIRQHFNNGGYLARVQSGEITTSLSRNAHLEPPPHGEPTCTRSQILYYYTQDSELLAVVHQYYRPDGTIGASGLPDPKVLVLENRILAVPTSTDQR